ncbi:MAG: type II CAAX prenyl endopeptidase Rce1 family protein, partial [Anaerolineales bacterium]
HRTGLMITVGVSALIFAVAHHGRSLIDTAILFTDGIGFALAFVITSSLWVPVIWHASKNLSVWLFLGSGTIELTHGLFEFQQPGLGLGFGSPDSAGLLDLGITVLVVGVAALSLAHSRVKDIKAGS